MKYFVGPSFVAMLSAVAGTPAVFFSPSALAQEQTCDVVGDTLTQSIVNFGQQCPSFPRVDCDPVTLDGQPAWRCASFQIGAGSPPFVVPPTDSTDDSTTGGIDTGNIGTSPVGDTNTTGVIQNRTDANVYTVHKGSDNPDGAGWYDSFSVNGKCYIDTTGDHGVFDLTVQTPYGVKTVREINDAQNRVGKPPQGNNPVYNDIQCGNGPANNAGDEDIGRCPGRVDGGNSQCGKVGPQWELDELFATDNNKPSVTYQSGDFLSLHWDSSMDPDDLQAMIATREILDTTDLEEGTDFIAINGTKKLTNERTVGGSLEHMLTMYPKGLKADNGVNQFVQSTINEVAGLWEMTLRGGGTVFVAEGGPSDFTAQVVRRIVDRKNIVGFKNRIRVIQHSHGWNEINTSTEALNFIKNMVTYIHIDDGNVGGNSTPDWNSGTGDNAFRDRALSSKYGQQWNNAFGKIGNKVDFSDGVEIFEIFGIPKSRAPTPAAFADEYF